MIVSKKQIGTRKDSKGNDKPIFAPDIPDELKDKVHRSTKMPDGTYKITFKEEHRMQMLKAEIQAEQDAKTKANLDKIADLIEQADLGSSQGKIDLADKIRNANKKK